MEKDANNPAKIHLREGNADLFVILAQAGIQCFNLLDSRLRGNDETE
jgi:hypothetical protein